MADLVTHTCLAYLCKALRPRVAQRPAHIATFILGTCVPDLLGRVPSMGLTVLRWGVPAIPEWAIYVWVPFHMPVGVALSSFILSFLFPEALRRVAFLNLLGGGLLHLGVDLLQRHFGIGYLLFFPFSLWDFELGWIGSEDTVRIVPLLVPLTAAVAWWRQKGAPARTPKPPAGSRPA